MTIQEYEYRPPNVRAVKWDGTEDTAALILKSAPVTALFTTNTLYSNLHKKKFVALFFGEMVVQGAETVRIGDYIVFEPDGRIRLARAAEFEYSYQKVCGEGLKDNLDRPKHPVTIEDDDYTPHDLGEHPPTHND